MLNTLFRGHWLVQFLFAALAFAAAAFLYLTHQDREAEKVLALQQGVPAAVSLNVFDPAKDIHPADEVHVIGWVNTDYNYELTETSRKRSDVVRRMFVLFGPEDTAETKTARAVVLMPEYDVDRFIEGLMTTTSGMADGGNPVFALNGTADPSPTLDNMANDALREKGLTKAPGFQFIEIWPQDGRAAALAPDPTTGLIVAGGVGAFGLLLLLVGVIKFRRRGAKPALAPAVVAPKPWGEAGVASPATPLSAPVANAAVDAALAARPKRGLPVAPESYAFLGIAIAIGMVSTWTGGWQLMILAFVMGGWHFVARVKRAMDKGVTAVASSLTEVKGMAQKDPATAFATFATAQGTASQSRPESYGLPSHADQSAVTRVPSPVERIMALGRTTPGAKVMQMGGALVILVVVALFMDGNGLTKVLPTLSVAAEDDAQPPQDVALVKAPEVDASATAAVADPAPEVATTAPAATAPAVAAPVGEAPVVAVAAAENGLIPEAASLRPKAGKAGAVVAASPPAVAHEPAGVPDSAPEVAALVTDAAPVDAAPIDSQAPQVASVPAEPAVAPAAEPPVVAVATAPADSAPQVSSPQTTDDPAPSFMAGLAGLGSLLVLAPIAGAVLLAVAAFALMRGRQAAPPSVFAGRDPWDRLARDVRSA